MLAHRIPWIDLSHQTRAVRASALERWESILATGDFSNGEATRRFEQEWADYVGVRHAVACGDGTMAVALMLQAAQVGPGDEVITAPTTYFATVEGIVLAGACPTFADVDTETGNLDPASVEGAVTSATRAIVAVHLGGLPAPMEDLRAVARRHSLLLFEDAAQAHGAQYLGRRAGALGDAASFSFYPTKNLGAFGEAGCVTTSDEGLAARVRALRDHGQRERHCHELFGCNSRLDSLQAAVLSAKLPHLDKWNEERRRQASCYRAALAELPVRLNRVLDGAVPVYHLFTIRTPRRDDLARFLAARGIGTGSHYPIPVHRQPAVAARFSLKRPCKNGETYEAEQLSLPLYPGLAEAQLREVAHSVREFFGPEGLPPSPPSDRAAGGA